MKKICLTVFSVFCLLLTVQLNAQTVKIKTTNLKIENNQLVINYDFVKSKNHQRFNVWLEITKTDGATLNAVSVSGDIGSNIAGGTNKQAVWDYNKDGIILNEEINVEVIAEIVKPSSNIAPGKAILLSAIVPGLGLSKIDGGKPYWIMGIATYGTLGASYLLNKQAVTDYNSYLETNDESQSDNLFNDSKSKQQLSKTMVYTAAGFWTINMVWTIIKAKKSGTSVASVYNKKKLLLFTGIDPFAKTAGFNLKYRF